MSRVWVAGEDEAGAVAALMVAFRDHLGASSPPEGEVLASVERLHLAVSLAEPLSLDRVHGEEGYRRALLGQSE